MIKEIQAKVLLAHVQQPDDWFGLKYNMNLYRGCQHQCIYCDSRSECYRIENFKDVLVKANAIELLRRELASKRVKGTVGTGSMHDPYMPAEDRYGLTGQALEVIAEFRFPVHVITKSDLILRDLDTLCQINRLHASVCFTVTTVDDGLAKRLEPGAPSPSRRFKAMQVLASHGIPVGVTLMPLLPFIEDNEENVAEIVRQTRAHGGSFIVPAFGVTLRDRQRTYYYEELDKLFPGLSSLYQRKFGNRYFCPANDAERLAELFHGLCDEYGIGTRVQRYEPETAKQLSLF